MSFLGDWHIQSRRERALSQALLLVDVTKKGVGLVVHVLGSANKVYDITFRPFNSPACNCWDFKRRKKPCKHILFVLLRVLNVKDDFEWENLSNLDTLAETLSVRLTADAEETVVASSTTRQSFKEKVAAKENQTKAPRNDECGFCLENLKDVKQCGVCNNCSNAWHTVCWERWTKVSRKHTCIICRRHVYNHKSSPYIELERLDEQLDALHLE